MRPRPLWVTLLVNTLAALVAVSLVQAFLVSIYRVPSASMERTLQAIEGGGDRILVNRRAYADAAPRPGDVVVFARPVSWENGTATGPSGGLRTAVRAFGDLTGIGASNKQYLVKRVVAAEGDTVSCCSANGNVMVNGSPIDEPYIFEDLPFSEGQLDCTTETRSFRCLPDYTVATDELLVLGDHRSDSIDSAIFCRTQGDSARADKCYRPVPESAIVGKVFLIVWPLNRIGTPG